MENDNTMRISNYFLKKDETENGLGSTTTSNAAVYPKSLGKERLLVDSDDDIQMTSN